MVGVRLVQEEKGTRPEKVSTKPSAPGKVGGGSHVACAARPCGLRLAGPCSMMLSCVEMIRALQERRGRPQGWPDGLTWPLLLDLASLPSVLGGWPACGASDLARRCFGSFACVAVEGGLCCVLLCVCVSVVGGGLCLLCVGAFGSQAPGESTTLEGPVFCWLLELQCVCVRWNQRRKKTAGRWPGADVTSRTEGMADARTCAENGHDPLYLPSNAVCTMYLLSPRRQQKKKVE